MKQLLILVMAFSLATACNNKKEKSDRDRGSDRRERDDYRDSESKDRDDDKKSTDYNDDREDTKPAKSGSGWSSLERNSFVTNCAAEASKGGMTRSAAESYCTCMAGEIEAMYPDPMDAGKLTTADMETEEMKSKIKACLTGGN